MVEERDRPTLCADVTREAVSVVKLTLMDRRCMAEATRLFRVILSLCTVGVTAITRLIFVSTFEREAGHRVIEVGLLPAYGAVTL